MFVPRQVASVRVSTRAGTDENFFSLSVSENYLRLID